MSDMRWPQEFQPGPASTASPHQALAKLREKVTRRDGDGGREP